MEIDELYQTIILDHSKRPRNFGDLPPPAAKGEGYNPSCGDEVVVFVSRSPHGTIEHIRFTGQADKAESLEQELSENSLHAWRA